MRLATLLTLALFVAVTAVPSFAQLINGNCEDGTYGAWGGNNRLTGWVFEANLGTTANWYIGAQFNYPDSQVHSGAKAGGAYIKAANGKTCQFTQRVLNLEPNATYDVSAWLKATVISGWPSGAWLALGAKNADNSGYTWSDHHYGNDFTQYTVRTTANAAGQLDIRIYADLQDGDVWADSGKTSCILFDDVELTMVPEPSSFLALLSGLPLLGAAIRRR